MAKAANIAGPIALIVMVRTRTCHVDAEQDVRRGNGGPAPPGVAGHQQGSVCGDAGDGGGDEEEQEPSSLREGALRRLHLQQLGPREHDPPGPQHQPALQGPGARRGLRRRECRRSFDIVDYLLITY